MPAGITPSCVTAYAVMMHTHPTYCASSPLHLARLLLLQPSFMDIPSVSEMLDITADLGMLEELMQQHGPRHAPDLKSSSTTDSITPFNPAWPYLHLAPHVDLTAAARMH